MQHATPSTVLGDYNAAPLQYFDTRYRFFQRDDQFYIDADGPDGTATEYQVLYTFGVYPLQQYLVQLDGGRLQALPVAWDTRPVSEGGQRWFHLYPDEQIDHNDDLHWTGLNQNWNFMCADCHSTNLKQGYQPQSNSFQTSWSEISVGCEACHGPGDQHRRWAQQPESVRAQRPDNGLPVTLKPASAATWSLLPKQNTASRSPQWDGKSPEIAVCARCHSRRLTLAEDRPGSPLEDSRTVSLLGQSLYHSDGQIKDEVFEYGSFVQSKMYHQGVSCGSCHDPHTLKLKAPGAQVCALCHRQQHYASVDHDYHPPTATPAASNSSDTNAASGSPPQTIPDCLDCHMPSQRYMVVDPRRDHSLRVPRPDLSEKLGSPNPCLNCHRQQTDRWAADALRNWLGRDARGLQDYAQALDAGRSGALDAEQQLVRLIEDQTQPAIARASALQLLPPYLSQRSFEVLTRALKNTQPMIRKAALAATRSLSSSDRRVLLSPLLSDPLTSVRIEAARLLATIPAEQLAAKDRQPQARALEQFRQAQLMNGERPESHLNLGNLLRQQNQLQQAEQAYRQAISRQPTFSPAWSNLADLYRQQGDESRSMQILRQGLAATPEDPGLLMALGFAQVRQQQQTLALDSFAAAVAAAPDNSRNRYIYGVALRSAGQRLAGLEQLQQARQLFPANPDLLRALLDAMLQDPALQKQDPVLQLKLLAKALQYARELSQITPPNPQLQRLIEQLDQRL